MTVEELIEKLKEFNPTATVVTYDRTFPAYQNIRTIAPIDDDINLIGIDHETGE